MLGTSLTYLHLTFVSTSSGYAGYKLCYYEVMKVIKGIVHQPYEVKGSSVFYAFSYYFDRAVESGLIGEWAQTEMLLYLPVPLSFQLIIIFCTKSVFKLHVCLFFPAQMAVEVVRLK